MNKQATYNRTISLSKLLMIIKHNVRFLLFFVIAFSCFSFAYSGIKGSFNNPYKSSGVIVAKQNLSNKVMGTMNKLVTSTLVSESAYTKLSEAGVKFSSGKEITAKYISSNTSSSYKTNTNSLTISFKSDDKKIVEQVLNIVLESTIEQSAKFDTLRNRFEIGGSATKANKPFNTNILKNIIIFSMIGLVVGLFVLFLKEYYDDKIYYSYELESLGVKTHCVFGYKRNIEKAGYKFDNSIESLANKVVLYNYDVLLLTTPDSSMKPTFNVVQSLIKCINRNQKTSIICYNLTNDKDFVVFNSSINNNNSIFKNNAYTAKSESDVAYYLDNQTKDQKIRFVLFENPVNSDDSTSLKPFSKKIFVFIKTGKTKKRDLVSLYNSLDDQFELMYILIE